MYFRFILFLGVEVPSSGLMSVVSARLGKKHFGALLLLFKLVSGSASLLVFMVWDASNESLFSWICSVERQFHTRAGLNMYRGWHGTTCIQPWKAQLASHKSCNVSTRVYNRCSVRVGVSSHHKMYTKSVSQSPIYLHRLKKNQTNRFPVVNNRKQTDPNPGAHSDCHTETQTHTHTDTHTTISKSLCSHHNHCWNIWSDFCQLLSNSS